MKWISLEKNRPPNDSWVIVYGHPHDSYSGCETPSPIAVARFIDKYKSGFELLTSGCGCCDDFMEGVTHWMPLPAPPDSSEDSNR